MAGQEEGEGGAQGGDVGDFWRGGGGGGGGRVGGGEGEVEGEGVGGGKGEGVVQGLTVLVVIGRGGEERGGLLVDGV